MLQIHWFILFLIALLSVIYFHFILFTFTTVLIVALAVYLALEVNARDLTQLNYFKNNQLFDSAEETICLIGRADFLGSTFFNCFSSINSKSSPFGQQLFGSRTKATNYQQKYFSFPTDDRASEVYTGDARIDEQINDLINLVLRDYVYSWYANVSSNQEFINELKQVLQTIIRLLVGRISKIDKLHYITIKLVDNFVGHLKLYRMAKQHLKANKIDLNEQNLIDAFFSFELNSESNRFCRDAVSENNDHCLTYLTELTNILEYLLLPPDIFHNRTIKYFVNSIIINSTFYPLLELLSDPDFINQTLISVCKTRKLNISLSESFLIILRSCANNDELYAVLESVREEIASQRSKDSGGDDDFEIKQQLSSLMYVSSIIKERLKLLNETGSSVQVEDNGKHNLEENNNFNSQKNDLFSLNFDFVLTNPLALTYFFEYMITINKQSYLNFYLSVEGFRLSVEQKLVAIQMKESQELIEASDYGRMTDEKSFAQSNRIEPDEQLSAEEILNLNNELKDHQTKMIKDNHLEDATNDDKLIEKLEMEMKKKLEKLKEDNEKAVWLNNLIMRAREDALNIFDTYLSPNSKQSNRIVMEDWLIHDLRNKIDNEELSETWFDTIHQLIYRRMREEETFFGTFKKSIHYYKLLKELRLLKNSNLNRDRTTSASVTKQNNNQTSTQSQNSNFYIELDNDTGSMKSNQSSNDTESLSSLRDRKLIHHDHPSEVQETVNNLSTNQNEETELSDRTIVKLECDIISTSITREFGKEFGTYCISVIRQDYHPWRSSDTDYKEEKWFVVRRYSDFYTFHQHTIKLFPQLTTHKQLVLPGKKPFANINQEFLEQRKQSLNAYLKQILNLLNIIQSSAEQIFGVDKIKFRDHIIQFFESGNYYLLRPKQSSNKNTHTTSNNQILTKTMNSVFNPFKSIKNKPVNLIEGIAKIKPFGNSSSTTNSNQQDKNQTKVQQNSITANQLTPTPQLTTSFSSSSLSNLQQQQNFATSVRNQLSNQFSTNFENTNPTNAGAKNLIESETNIPLRILLLLMDEIFDLKSKSFWLRRRIFNVIKQIIQSTYGNTINRKIISFINRLFSSSYIESYIKTVKKTLWPNGYRAIPSSERDRFTKLRTKVATKMLLLGIIPDDLLAIVGSETSRKSVMGLFNMLQCSVLNRRLVIVIFETFLIQLFPENELDKVFERLHSANSKHKDKFVFTAESQTTSSWPPYLSRMNMNSNLSSNSEPSSKASPVFSK